MRAVAETEADRVALDGADRYVFGAPAFDFDQLAAVDPAALAAALAGTALAESALKFLTVMALIDGRLDKAKVARVQDYAAALHLTDRYLDEIVEAARGRVREAMADMTRANMLSITGKPWTYADAGKWILPHDTTPDPALAARFHALEHEPEGSFGKAFWLHFTTNGYAFPGEPKGLNAAFSIPHDSVHVLSGYNTRPRGELLASTFTAAMHKVLPMAGHILPVIFSWHPRLEINPVAGAAEGALDPEVFWQARAAGAAFKTDTFAPDWDFWTHTTTPMAPLRTGWGLPADGLDPRGTGLGGPA